MIYLFKSLPDDPKLYFISSCSLRQAEKIFGLTYKISTFTLITSGDLPAILFFLRSYIGEINHRWPGIICRGCFCHWQDLRSDTAIGLIYNRCANCPD